MAENTPPVLNWFHKSAGLFKSEKYHGSNQSKSVELSETKIFLDNAYKLYQEDNLHDWLASIVNFWNQYDTHDIEFSKLFHQWSIEEQQVALRHFSNPNLVHCINAIFFYKLYPDKLFNELIHPEKLVSVQIRLGVLHHLIEVLQSQLVHFALPHGLKPKLDYLFHGDLLPQGIMIEVDEQVRILIQTTLMQLKVKFTPENEAQVAIERLHDLARAYKYWFNPNRLIDAVMVLQQRLVKIKTTEESNLKVFKEDMVHLYGQLSTTQCLDLYGYFSNKDTQYLLNTLLNIIDEKPFSWLLKPKIEEKKAVESVFNALQSVLEAIRIELKNRNINTDPYITIISKNCNNAGKRNREAVHRIIAIYGGGAITSNESVERLFRLMEGYAD